MKLIYNLKLVLPFFILVMTGAKLTAQSAGNSDPSEILRLDSLFWDAYNTCNIEKMKEFFTDDLEFYHDKGGLTSTSAKLMETTKKNLCSNENWRLRR